MGVEAVTPNDVALDAVATLGLDVDAVDITSVEALAAALRRAASFLCPTTHARLVRSVDEAIRGLPGCDDATTALIESTLDSLLSYGDLIELTVDEAEGRRRKLFLGPPSFVRRRSGACLLVGVRPEGAPLVGDRLLSLIEHEEHVRLLPTEAIADDDRLLSEGLAKFELEQWLRCPRSQAADELVVECATRLEAAGSSGVIDGLSVLDPTASVSYYRGRWRDLREKDVGTFVARRPQGYGADIWCFVDVASGEVRRGFDLPIHNDLGLGADEAWRLQAAIDYTNGTPQLIKTRQSNRLGWSVVDLFSPVPSWMQRRLDIVGMPLLRSRGALLSYGLPDTEVREEVEFVKDMMWLVESSSEGISDG